MDYLERFDIVLEKDIWYPGEVLKGDIYVHNTEALRVSGIQVILRGKAHVEWKIVKAGEKRTVKEDQYFIDEKFMVWGNEKRENQSCPILKRGRHKYPIKYSLPVNGLPCSFESKNGTIRYYVRVFVFVPHLSSPQHVKYFTVIGPHIDCMDPEYTAINTIDDHHQTCCLCCQQTQLKLSITLQRTAYCCGETLKLRGSVYNNKGQDYWVVCRLMQYVEYFISRGVLGITKEHQHKVIDLKSEPIPPGERWAFDETEFDLKIPVIPPTLVSLSSEKIDNDLEIEVPITIATLPFRVPDASRAKITYEHASLHVEGGLYISPEFRMGQVYTGEDLNPDEENQIIYRPVYPCLTYPSEQGPISENTN